MSDICVVFSLPCDFCRNKMRMIATMHMIIRVKVMKRQNKRRRLKHLRRFFLRRL